ncbi:MAG TPA: 30S ribosomal protein S12 methylthiotransferase RimO [Firmicutes bacterium]|nr:30S ribosomal protein S12 methylthiotransferase RimO [Bacillota bacterium]
MATRVGMMSLGCPKNQVDGEMILASFANAGYKISEDPALADVVIINTCGFIEDAKKESIETILEFCTLKKEGRIKCVVITGCLSERYREQVAQELPEVDVILGIGKNEEIVGLVEQALAGERVVAFDEKEKLPLSGDRVLTNLPFYAYLKIAEGCNNRCSYCAIPMIRGRYRSKPMEEILDEARRFARNGITELIVVAQDPTRYGEDLYGENRLPQLLTELCKLEGIRWIRTLYTYPERITDELLDVLAKEEKLVKYLDIPMQHCDGEILKRMHRVGDKHSLLALIKKIRERVPGISLRSTLIVGFPGETKAQFADLCDFVKEAKFDHLGCFAYSAEEGTPAASFPDQIDEEVKLHRAEIIMDEQYTIQERKMNRMIGKTVTVVAEGYDRYAECYFGRTDKDAPDIDGKVFFTSPKENKPKVGQYLTVKITDTLDGDLVGDRVEEGGSHEHAE